jgi:diguanylate cyclase (GGDEF)-like protein
MYSLDAVTVGMVYSFLSLGLAIFVALASRQADGERGFAEWTLASASLGVAFPLNFMQTQLPLGFAIGVSNFLFMLGWCFHYSAVRAFFGRSHPHGLGWKLPWALALGHGTLMAWLAVGLESVPARLFFFNASATLTMAAAALAVRPPAHGALRTAAQLMRWIFAAIALLHACRVLWFLIAGSPDRVTAPIPIQVFVGLALSLLQIAATFAFLLMQNFRLNDELREQADLDSLTGVFNRRGLDLRARRSLARARTTGSPAAVIIMDIDRFKQINDTHGHPFGDQVLCWLSEKLPALLRPHDLLGRYGGEEFVALLPDADITTAQKVAERMRASIAAYAPEFEGTSVRITLSLGIALAQDADYELEACLAQADACLYQAKKAGRNQVCYLPLAELAGDFQFAV